MSALPAAILPSDISVSREYAALLDTPEGVQFVRVAANGAFTRHRLEKAIVERDWRGAKDAADLLCAVLEVSDGLAVKGAGSLPPWQFAIAGTTVRMMPSAAKSEARPTSEPQRIDITLHHEPIKVKLDQGKRRATRKTMVARRLDDGSLVIASDEQPT